MSAQLAHALLQGVMDTAAAKLAALGTEIEAERHCRHAAAAELQTLHDMLSEVGMCDSAAILRRVIGDLKGGRFVVPGLREVA